jgi:hypothetical protein
MSRLFVNIRAGQLWRCADPRRFKICRVVDVNGPVVKMLNIVTGHVTTMQRAAFFFTGTHGWSLERDVR